MFTYFADTWYFIALHDRLDRHHTPALRIQTSLRNSPIVTHEAIFMELLAHFADDGAASRTRVSNVVHNLLKLIDVVSTDRDLFLRAVDRYAARPDKEFSIVDCMSMIVMEDRGIRHVLTNDHHFSQAGFIVVSDGK